MKKKSLVQTRETVKKAVIASAPEKTNVSAPFRVKGPSSVKAPFRMTAKMQVHPKP